MPRPVGENGSGKGVVRGAPSLPGYRLLRALGAGGMGSVYAVEKLSTHQKYAVKFLREDHLDNDRSRARFKREIRALRSIRHPHVVAIFDGSVPERGEPGRPYVVMELLEGEGLDRILRRRGKLPPAVAVSVMLQVLDGLAAVHAEGIIHRDLGPSNVFLVPQSANRYLAKVLDFGLSRSLEPSTDSQAGLTQRGTLMGKPAYVSPEMFRHEPLDARADIYACGMILFRMLSGRLPYRETQAQALWAERYAERDRGIERPSARSFEPSIAPELDACVARAVRLDPARRYQSAEDMQADLLRLESELFGFPGEIEITPTIEPAPPAPSTGAIDGDHPPLRRRRRWPWIVAALALAAAAAALALFGRGEEREEGAVVAFGSEAEADVRAPSADAGGRAPMSETDVRAPGADAGGRAPMSETEADVREPRAETEAEGREPRADAGADSSGAAIGEEPMANSQQPTANGQHPTASLDTVHLSFEGVPPGSRGMVRGESFDPADGVDVPRSDRRLHIFVGPSDDRLEPWRGAIIPREDRVVRPRFRRKPQFPSIPDFPE